MSIKIKTATSPIPIVMPAPQSIILEDERDCKLRYISKGVHENKITVTKHPALGVDNDRFIFLQIRTTLTEEMVKEINESDGIVASCAHYGDPYFRYNFIHKNIKTKIMSKPIFIVRLPMSRYTHSAADQIAESIKKHSIVDDYHVLVMADEFTGGETKFECYNAPHTEMEFEELQRRVLELLKD